MSPFDAFLIPVHPALRNVFGISPLIPAKLWWFAMFLRIQELGVQNRDCSWGLQFCCLGNRKNLNYSISFFLPELFKLLTAHVAHQAPGRRFSSCGITLKLDFAEAKLGSSRQTKIQDHLQYESSRRQGCGEGKEGAGGKGNPNCPAAGSLGRTTLGSAVNPSASRGVRGGEKGLSEL